MVEQSIAETRSRFIVLLGDMPMISARSFSALGVKRKR
jgi:hypothetical protein